MRACLSSNQQRTPRGTITPTEDAAALVGLNRMLLSRCFHMPLGNRFWLRFDRHCNRLRPVEVLRWALCFSISQRQRKAGRMTTAFETAWQKLATSLGPAQNEKEAANQTRGVHRHLCARYWRGGGRPRRRSIEMPARDPSYEPRCPADLSSGDCCCSSGMD